MSKITIVDISKYRKEVKKLWEKMKKEVDKSEILEIEVDRKTMPVVGEEFPDIMYTGEFEIKVRCMTK